VLLPPVKTVDVKTDEDIDRLISDVRAAVATELETGLT
jgi:hypothetical protein